MPAESVDLYEVLGVARDVTPEELRRAYLQACARVHPDTGGTGALFRLVTQAYETLSDPVSRSRYDGQGAPSAAAAPQSEVPAVGAPAQPAPQAPLEAGVLGPSAAAEFMQGTEDDGVPRGLALLAGASLVIALRLLAGDVVTRAIVALSIFGVGAAFARALPLPRSVFWAVGGAWAGFTVAGWLGLGGNP